MADPVRVFIGTEEKTRIMCDVLAFSILRRTSSPVELTPMIGPKWEYTTENIPVGTGFSLRRWLIPSRIGYTGRALYLDADQVVLADIAELWNTPNSGPSAHVTWQPDKFNKSPAPQTSVMLIDCDRITDKDWGWQPDKMFAWLRANPTKDKYAWFMHAGWMDPQPGKIPTPWNHLNVYTPPGKPKHTRLCHMTKENEQPPVFPANPVRHIWEAELKAAIEAGAVDIEDFDAAIALFNAPRLDHRPTQGLHPHYLPLRKLFPKEGQ